MKAAIVGGGPNGVITAGELARQILGVEVHMYGDGKWGHGTVYGERELDSSRQSFITAEMGIDPERPDAMAEWAVTTRPEGFDAEDLTPDAFPPRQLVGRYFHDRIEQVRELAATTGASLHLREERVIDIDDDQIITATNIENGFDVIFLCLGNFPSKVGREFVGFPGYHPEVWGKDMFDQIETDEDILVLGSGLSSIDMLFALRDRDHQGKIRFGSRNGLLPSVRARETRDVDMFEIIAELEETDGSFGEFLRVTSGYFPWRVPEPKVRIVEHPSQSHVRCLASYMPNIWRRFSVEDRQRFDRKLGTIWNALHLPMSEQAFDLICEPGDQFKVGVLSNVRFTVDHWEAEIEGETETFGRVINATGRNLNVETIEDPLIESLLKREALKPHSSGGFDVDFQGSSSGRIRVIGPLTRGVRFYTYVIEQNAFQIREALNALRCAVTR